MKYSRKIEKVIVEQIRREPRRPVILPDEAYWAHLDQPWIYIDSMPTPLMRHLYEILIEPLPESAGLANPPGVDARNVNPHLAVVTPTRRSRAACPNDHVYTEDDWIEGVGHQCQACRAAKLLGTPSASDINRAKTTCPEGHQLVKRPNGRRRCLECPRIRQAEYRARQRENA